MIFLATKKTKSVEIMEKKFSIEKNRIILDEKKEIWNKNKKKHYLFSDSEILFYDDQNIFLLVDNLFFFTIVYRLDFQKFIRKIFERSMKILITDDFIGRESKFILIESNLNDVKKKTFDIIKEWNKI